MKLTQPHTLTVEGKLVPSSPQLKQPKAAPKLFTWKPVPDRLATTTAGALVRARARNMQTVRYSPEAISVRLPRPQGQPVYWQDFVIIDHRLYTRPALRVNLTSHSGRLVQEVRDALPNPLAHFLCEACGRYKRLTHMILVDAGPTKLEALSYSICALCLKKGCLSHIPFRKAYR